jgi:serine/threonine protein kinase/tetratricopeptide (TPR) repeat protein
MADEALKPSPLEPPAGESTLTASPGRVHAQLTARPGDRFGRYKILEEIGQGGCGAVFVAEQEEPVRRRVALKVIKLGMDTHQVIARFEVERQALAMMDHPNIARVLDAGSTDTGRPFFVMELVRGIKITDYCDQHKLSTTDRLNLFIQVCQAVQHAHQKGIIHRDLKPSNILVTLHDAVPVPKVIDFGIAKATADQKLTDKTVYTALEQFIGTPAYMSPEQAEMSGLDVDTRTDIYSLGVLLYELLTGETPFNAEELLAQGLEAMRRTLRETEPARPSTRLSTMGADLAAIALHRQSDAPKLVKLVRGELDWIVMKCLEKDRARRYDTANGLAMDIQRHLNQEPVTAAAPSALYRATKFVRRHKAGLATATALVLLLAGGVIASTLEAVRAKKAEILAQKRLKTEANARRLADDSRRAAEAEAAKATAIRNLLESALQSTNPDQAKGSDYTVRQLLDDFSSRLGDQLKNQPEIEAEIRAIIGNAYRRVLATEKAQAHLEAALGLRRRIFGDQHPKVAESLLDLAFNEHEQRHDPKAEELTRQALAIFRQQGLKRESVQALALLQLCLFLHQDRLSEAEQVSAEALTLAQEIPGAKLPETANILHRLSGIKRSRRDYAEAERLGQEAVVLHRQLHGDNHPETGFALRDLASTFQVQGKYAEAAVCYAEVRAIFQRQYGTTHSLAVDASRSLASALTWAGKLDEAESVWGDLLELAKQVSDIGQAGTLNEIAWQLVIGPGSKLWKGADLINVAEKAVALTSRTNEMYLDTLAAAYAAVGQYTNAVKVQQEAIALLQNENQKQDFASRLRLYAAGVPYRYPDHGALAVRTADLLAAGRFTEAEPLARECLALREKLIPHEWRTFNARSMLGGCLLGQKKYDEAEPLLVAGYEGLKCRQRRIPPEGKPNVRVSLERLVLLNEALAAASPADAQDRQESAAAYRLSLNLLTNSCPLPTEDYSRLLALADQAIARAQARTNAASEAAAFWEEKARLLEAAGRSETALAAMTKAVELASADTNGDALTATDARLSRWGLLQRMNRPAEAAEDRRLAFNIPQRDGHSTTNLVDLSLFYNRNLKQSQHGGAPNNTLAALPEGSQILGEVQFDIRGLIQLAGAGLQTQVGDLYPLSATSLPIGRKFARLHVLHGAAWDEQEGAKVGAYVLHYADGGQLELPIRYGEDVRNWWNLDDRKEASRATVAWTGQNPAISSANGLLRLFKRTWDNPRPDALVESIGFTSSMTKCAPFLISLTLE